MVLKEVTIQVRLLDEGTDVWRPVRTQSLEDGSFLIIEDQKYTREDEKWEFEPGTKVICEKMELREGTSKGPCLVAVRACS